MLTEQDRSRITSNDYTDLMVEYNRNPRIFETFPNAVYQVLNERYAVVYVPANLLSMRVISQYRYASLPACFGLTAAQGDSSISLEASGVTKLRRSPLFNLLGEGVLIGIVDTGIDYTNPVFINPDGTSRIAAIWDQTIESDRYPPNTLFGTEYFTEELNQALASDNPLQIVPSVDEVGHGTMLAGIAAGNVSEENNFSGVAPAARFVIVKLKQAKQALRNFFVIPADVVAYQENDLMWGIQYIIDTARRLGQPVSVCIGVGSSQGSHDGRGAFSHLLSIAGDFPGVVINIAAGNEGNRRRHFFSTIASNTGMVTVELNIGEGETGFTMELWGTAPNTYSIDILSPSGEYIPRIAEGLRVSREINFIFIRTVIFVDYQLIESSTGDQVIIMRFQQPAAGIWRFQVFTRGDLQGSFHIWLPSDDFITGNTYFTTPDPFTTITSPGNSLVPITVTAYNPIVGNTLYQGASRGYSRIGTIKPEIAAPGVNLPAPTLGHGFTLMTGTSAAAAHTTGVSAILLEWGIVRNNYPGIDSVEVKRFIIRGADRNAGQTYPNRDWGYGILDLFNVFDILRANTMT